MDPMPVTDEVSQLETSREASDEQPLNMDSISFTDDVSQPETLSEVSEVLLPNM